MERWDSLNGYQHGIFKRSLSKADTKDGCKQLWAVTKTCHFNQHLLPRRRELGTILEYWKSDSVSSFQAVRLCLAGFVCFFVRAERDNPLGWTSDFHHHWGTGFLDQTPRSCQIRKYPHGGRNRSIFVSKNSQWQGSAVYLWKRAGRKAAGCIGKFCMDDSGTLKIPFSNGNRWKKRRWKSSSSSPYVYGPGKMCCIGYLSLWNGSSCNAWNHASSDGKIVGSLQYDSSYPLRPSWCWRRFRFKSSSGLLVSNRKRLCNTNYPIAASRTKSCNWLVNWFLQSSW